MKQLPASPNLSHLKKQAKELLRARRKNDPEAIRQFLEYLPSARNISTEQFRLHDAQSCIAREYGFESWAALKTHVEQKLIGQMSREEALKRWLELVYGVGFQGPRPALAVALMRERGDLLNDDPYLACAVGDEAKLRATLANHPEWANRPGGALGMPPLVAVTHSGLLRHEEFADALVRCATLLLDNGANPDQIWTNPEFPQWPLSAIYGAAGKNHHPGMTRLLLERGANPNDNESLYHSMESPDLTCTQLLLEHGAKVDGSNAIGHVLDYDRPEGLRLLLSYGGNPGYPGASDFPIFHAIKRGRSVEHVRMLLDAGADKNVRNSDGYTPYEYALLYGQTELAAMLSGQDGNHMLSAEDAFVAACARGDRNEVKRLLSETPDIVQRLSEKQLRQLPNLAAQGNFTAVKTMVEAGWPIETRGGDWEASALNLAVYRGDAAMTEFLLDHGADWQQKHGYGGNAMGTLSWASVNNGDFHGDWVGCAKAMIAHGMPLPPLDRYEFSEEVTDYFENLRTESEPG